MCVCVCEMIGVSVGVEEFWIGGKESIYTAYGFGLMLLRDEYDMNHEER